VRVRLFSLPHIDAIKLSFITVNAGGCALTSGRWLIGTVLVMATVLFGVKAWVDKKYMSKGELC
jgi:hypothetical protein